MPRGSQPLSTSSASVSSIRYGLTARGAVADQRRDVVDARAARRTRRRARPAGACPRGRGGGGRRRPRAATGSARARRRRARSERIRMLTPSRERRVGLARRPLERARPVPPAPLGDRPGDVDRVRLEDRRVDLAQRLELVRCAGSGCRSRAGARARASRRAGCRSAPTLACDAHHDRLADRVDRRVRDLREELLEVASRGAACGRRAPRAATSLPIEPIGSSPLRASGARITLQVLLRVAERELALSAAARSRGARGGARGQVGRGGRRCCSNHSP